MVVYAGADPVTGKRVYVRETVQATDKAARKRAIAALTRLLNQVNEQNSAPSTVALSHALSEWIRTNELEERTRHTSEGYMSRTIRPTLGETAVNKISPHTLENFYTELRRCRVRCDGKPYVEKHRNPGKHDCVAENCKPHACKPMGSSTMRQIHAILSGVLDAAVRRERKAAVRSGFPHGRRTSGWPRPTARSALHSSEQDRTSERTEQRAALAACQARGQGAHPP